jgi:hypothetical protein
MGDDSIDMVIAHIDMGYLVALPAICTSPPHGLMGCHVTQATRLSAKRVSMTWRANIWQALRRGGPKLRRTW